MKKLFIVILLSFSFNAIAQDIYIEKVEVSNGIEHVTKEKLTDTDSTFIYDLSVQRIYSYMDTIGTFQLSGEGCLVSSHHIKVKGTTTLQFGNLPLNATIYLMLEQDATGGYTINLPTFDNLDTQPTVSTVANKMDVLIIMKMGSLIHLHSYIRYNDTF